jgi:hypothetical protein
MKLEALLILLICLLLLQIWQIVLLTSSYNYLKKGDKAHRRARKHFRNLVTTLNRLIMALPGQSENNPIRQGPKNVPDRPTPAPQVSELEEKELRDKAKTINSQRPQLTRAQREKLRRQ